jgi:short-subunit dehydrogenase
MTVLITGASKGIGKELAYEFARNGHNLLLVARSLQLLTEIKDDIEAQYSVAVDVVQLDLCNQDAREIFLENLNHDIEILVNNAGFGDFALFPESELQKNLQMLELNVKALVHFSHFFSSKFINENNSQKQYKILNIASIAGFCPGAFMANYFATKAYVISFSRALYQELKKHKIHVACCCPGATHSDFGKVANVDSAIAFKFAMPAKKVAEITYKDLFKNKNLIITGVQNQFLVGFMKLMPASLLAKMNAKIMKN